MKGDCDKKRAELDQQILALHQSGVNRFAIASQLNISQKRVKGAYRRLGLEIGPIVKTTTQSTIDKGLALYRLGLGFKMAAAKVGIKPGLLIYHIRKRGLIRHNTRVWMKGRKIPEGYKRKPQYKASTLIERGYRSEANTLKSFDVEHWSRHPEVLKYHAIKSSQSRADRWRGFNYNLNARAKKRLRHAIWKAMKYSERTNTLAVKAAGCQLAELRTHIESLFVERMCWDNYGTVWEVDHIVPCSLFDLTQWNEVQQCFHFSNLRPCIVSENRTKSAKHSGPVQIHMCV